MKNVLSIKADQIKEKQKRKKRKKENILIVKNKSLFDRSWQILFTT